MKAFYIYFCLLYSYTTAAQCSGYGPQNASVFSNNASVGTFAWANHTNAQLSDNNYATAGQLVGLLSTVNSNYILITNLGFSIPTSAAICGITAEVERSASGILIGSSIKDNSIRIVKAGVVTGTNHANGTDWPSLDAYATYGANNDLWGTTLTAADINSSDFGIAISVRLSAGLAALFLTAQLDHIRVTVYYDIPIPVKLKSFTATAMADQVKLEWVTVTEINNKCFLVEKSSDGSSWLLTDSLPGSGDSQSEKYYYSVDRLATPLNLYRLKQVDFDGRISFSRIVKTGQTSEYELLVYPNPVTNFCILSSKTKIDKIQFYNETGREVNLPYQKVTDYSRRYYFSSLQAGVYYIRLNTGGSIVSKSITVLK